MRNLYIDFDGVIVNTIEISYKIAEEMGVEKNYDAYLHFFQNLDWNDVLDKCRPINDSFNCIKKIIQSDLFSVAILTHVTSLSEAEAKIKIIRKHLDDITIIPVPKTVSKTQIVKTEGSILIDDYALNLEEWEENGGIGVRFDLSMDGKGFPVIDRLDQIFEVLD